LVANVKEKTMANKRFWLRILVLVLVFGMIVSGCSTTHSITYASAEQSNGDYKYVVISAVSGNASVLQRFYKMYPSSQYEVVAYEKMEKKWIPLVTALGGGLIGGVIGSIPMSNQSDSQTDEGEDGYAFLLPIITAGGFAVLGYSIGDLFKENYIVTYVERVSSLSE
jgi:uncharacterized protein YceK